MIAPRKSGSHEQEFHVGDLVSFAFGIDRGRGTIVEDRGLIGSGGRRLYLVEMQHKYTEPFRFEMPAEEMTLEE